MRCVKRYAWTHKLQLSGCTVHSLYCDQALASVTLAGTLHAPNIYNLNPRYLLVSGDTLQRLLNDTTSVHLQRQRQHVTLNAIGEVLFLFAIAKLEELLNDVIAKHVRHQIVGGGQDFVEDHLFLGGRGTFQLLLDETRAVLVLRELHDMVSQVTQLNVRVTVVSEVFEKSASGRLFETTSTKRARGGQRACAVQTGTGKTI